MAQRAAPAPPRVAFSCAFARRNCPHEIMFQDAYQRCFPHCCPRHVERSYCGGSVYLQVDLARGDAGAVADDTLCVFAHFHPKAMPGLALGQRVARAMFRDNQQTDTKATGEWIGARLMASADHTTWMFEVNPNGRWYYQWESGATKAQRATEHVFEAYVLAVDPAFERCEVVAKTVSRDFKMISFRRAPSDTKPSTPEVPTTTGSPFAGQSEANQETKHNADLEETIPVSSASLRWMPRESVDSVASSDAEITSQFQTLLDSQSLSRNSSPLVAQSRILQSTRPSISPPSPTSGVSEDDQDTSAPLSLLPPPQVRRISHQLGLLVDFLKALPCSALELVLPDISRVVLAPFVSVANPRTNGPPPNLAALIGIPLGSHRGDRSTPTCPPALGGVVLRLALWILFDRELAHTQEAYIERASAGLLDKVALYESYYAWLERLQHHIERYFSARQANATLPTLANDARLWLLTRTTASSDSPLDMTGCRGIEAFVAQAREVFLADGDLRRRRPTPAPHQAEDAETHPDIHELALLSAVWVIDVDSIQWRAAAGAHEAASSGLASSPSAFVVLWAWRQVLGLELRVEDERTLTVSSLWNASAARGSRLVLDGKPRWLRVYPCGESTGSVTIGSQRLGHYVASFRRETRELLVNLYSWPTAETATRDACCYCSRWCLSLDAGEAVMRVRVAVERGRFRRGVDAAALDENSLTHKLQAVDEWATVASLQYSYRRR